MRGLGTGLGLGRSGSGTAAPTAIPALANLVARWSPDDIAMINGGVAPTDGTAVSSFADSVNGITLQQGTAAAKPAYKVNGKAGKPYLLMAAGKNLTVSSNAIVNTPLASADYTVMVLYRNVVASAFSVLCATSSQNLFAGSSSYTTAGTAPYAAGVSSGGRIPYAGSASSPDLQSVAVSVAPGSISSFVALNGASQAWTVIGAAANSRFDIGISTSSNSVIGELYDVLIWNRALTMWEAAQAHKWACEKYSQPHPITQFGKGYVALGSSQASGYGGATPPNDIVNGSYQNYAAVAARSLSYPMGTYFNLGIVGINADNLSSLSAAQIDGIPGLFPGTSINLSWLEWYNTQKAATGTVAAQKVLAATLARKNAGFNKIGLLTLTDSGDAPTTRSSYLSYLGSNFAAGGVSDLIRLDQNPNVGASGSAISGSSYFAGDLIHQLVLGHQEIATGSNGLTSAMGGW